MTTLYEVQVQDSGGTPLAVLDDWLALEYARTVNRGGRLALTVAASTPLAYFKRDGRIAVYRAADGPPRLELETLWLITRITQRQQGAQVTTEVGAVDGLDLLRRRIVDYAAGSAQAVYAATAADNAIKQVARENLSSSATDTSRILPSSLFRVAANTGQGASIAKAFSRRNVLATCQEFANASALAGTYVAFDVVWAGDAFELRTYPQWRGVDHRFPGGINPVILSPDNGALTEASYVTDYDDEVTRAIAGGQGEGSDRTIARATDSTRSTLSPLALIEGWANARQATDSTTVQDEADAALWAGRPRVAFACVVNADAPGVRYGREYGWGDVVTAQALGQSVDCRIDGVRVRVDRGRESVQLTLRSVA